MTSLHPNVQIAADFKFPAFGNTRFHGNFQKINKGYTCAAVVKDAPSLSEILTYIGVPTNPFFPDILLSDLAVAVDFYEKYDHYKVSITLKRSETPMSVAFSGNNALYEGFEQLDFSADFHRNKIANGKAKIRLSDCKLNLKNAKFNVPNVFEADLSLAFGYSSQTWALSASASNATLLGTNVDASITYKHEHYAHKLLFNLCQQSTLPLIDVGGVKLSAADMQLVVINANGRTEISASGHADLTLPPPFCSSIKGGIALNKDGLILKPMPCELKLSILTFPLPPESPLVDFGLRMQLRELSLSWGKKIGISATGSLEWVLTGIPKVITEQLPLGIELSFDVRIDDQGEVAFKFNATSQREPVPFSLPDIDIGGGETVKLSRLGQVQLGLQALGVSVKGSDIQGQLTFAFALPNNINHVFCKGEDQEPTIELFNTDLIELIAELGVVRGKPEFSLQLRGCPLMPKWVLNAQTPEKPCGNASENWHIKLGSESQYGEIRMKSPRFECNFSAPPDLTFTGNIDLTVEKPLRIPLVALQNFLALFMKPDEARNLVPNSLPITIPSLLTKEGKFATQQLTRFLENSLNVERNRSPVLDRIEEILASINQQVDSVAAKIPPRLKTYLQPQFADGLEGFSFAAKASIRADATFDFDVSMDADSTLSNDKKVAEGVRLLTFCPGIPPTLQGITFRRIAFGSVFGNTLLRTVVDCDFDQFDLIALAASIVLPENTVLPVSRDIQQTLTIRNLKALIAYEMAVPIPIPYYFDEIGYDYSDILGIGIHGHILVKRPKVDLGKLLNIFTNSRDFICEPGPRGRLKLNPTDFTAMLPALQLSNCYLQYPKFLSEEGFLGYKDHDDGTPFWSSDGIGIKAVEIIQDSLNTIKYFSIIEFVKMIPQPLRCKIIKPEHRLTFAGLDFNAELGWVLTSPADFCRHKHEYKSTIGESAGLEAMVIAVLGEEWATKNAAIVFLKTVVAVTPLSGLNMRFALVTTDSANTASLDGEAMRNGVATAFQLHGNVLALSIDLKALLVVRTAPAIHVYAKGHGDIMYGHWRLFVCTGELNISENGFVCSGNVCVLPGTKQDVLIENHKCVIGRQKGIDISLRLRSLSVYGIELFDVDFLAFCAGDTISIAYKGEFLGTSVTLCVDNSRERLRIYSNYKFGFGGLVDNEIVTVLEWWNTESDRPAAKAGKSLLSGSFMKFLGPLATTYKATFYASSRAEGSLEIALVGGFKFTLRTKVERDGPKRGFRYGLSGSFDLLPPNSPIKLNSKIIDGTISSDGISFESAGEWSVLGTGLRSRLIFKEANIFVEAVIKIAGIEISGASGIVTTWKEKPVICVSYITQFVFWKTRWYLGVSIDGAYLSVVPPPYWVPPTNLCTAVETLSTPAEYSGLIVEQDIVSVAPVAPVAPPSIDGFFIVDIVKNLLDSGQLIVAHNEDLENFEGVFYLYEISINETREEDGSMRVFLKANRPRPTIANDPFVKNERFFSEIISRVKSEACQSKGSDMFDLIESVRFDIDRHANRVIARWTSKDQQEIAHGEFRCDDLEWSCKQISEAANTNV